MLTSFPPLLSEVREKIGEVWNGGRGGGGAAAGDCTGFVGFENFSFSSLSACLDSLCTFNNAFPVPAAAMVVVCTVF